METYKTHENLSEETLACRLAMKITQLPRLALCKRPHSDGGTFQKNTRQIANYVGANVLALAQMLREVEVLEVFQTMPSYAEKENSQTAAFPAVLAAARDKDQQEENPDTEEMKPPEEDEQDHVVGK
jgi:hypothetical protein